MNTAQKLGTKIKFQRVFRKWSLEKLAEFSDLSSSAIGNIENAVSSPTVDTVEKIAKAFGIPLHEMFIFDDVEKFL